MKNIDNEFHILVIHEQTGNRPVYLIAPTYTLGRSKTCSIPLNSKSISREHAILIRMPSARTEKYQFRLLDGNANGKPSLNGFEVNGMRCTKHDLVDGDRIVLGGEVEATYQIRFVKESQLHPTLSDQDHFSPENQHEEEELLTILKS